MRKREFETPYQEGSLGEKQVEGMCNLNQDTMISQLNPMCWGSGVCTLYFTDLGRAKSEMINHIRAVLCHPEH